MALLDTRRKIVEALDGTAGEIVVSGYFDPLLAAHARRLEQLAEQFGPLVVAVLDPDNPLLPLRARAELVAALRCVKTVIAGSVPQHRRVIRLEEEDQERRKDLIRHVRRRHAEAAARP
jgi:phosphopantetheine adenylyltransferase